MKRRLALLMAGTLIVGSLVACGGNTTNTPKDNNTAEATTESLAGSD